MRTRNARLIAHFGALDFAPFQFHGFTGKRRVVYYGWRYDFEGGGLQRTGDIPSYLLPTREIAAGFAGIEAAELQQALVTEYAPGAAIGWHRDRSVFGDVLGISLLSACSFRLRRKEGSKWERRAFGAAPRSAYLLSGTARQEWEHSIPAVPALRYSITSDASEKLERRLARLLAGTRPVKAWRTNLFPKTAAALGSIVVGRLHEGVDLPDLVGRQAQAEGRHLRALAAVDHGLQELLVAELGGEEVRPARAGAVVADVALAAIDVAAGGDRVRLAEKRIGQRVLGRVPPLARSAMRRRQDRSERAVPRLSDRAPCRDRSGAPSLLARRQHLLDHLRVVRAALVDLAVDREHPQHPALRRRIVEARIAAEAGQNRDILLAVELVGDRRGVDARAGLELPQLLAGLGIDRRARRPRWSPVKSTPPLVASMPENNGSGLGTSQSDLLVGDVDRLQVADRVAHPVHLVVDALIDVAGLVYAACPSPRRSAPCPTG